MEVKVTVPVCPLVDAIQMDLLQVGGREASVVLKAPAEAIMLSQGLSWSI